VHVADSEQRPDVGIVRLGGKGVDEEEHRTDRPGRDPRGDLSVPALGTAQELFDFEAHPFPNEPRAVAGAHQIAPASRD
jgi:hypothetical protein